MKLFTSLRNKKVGKLTISAGIIFTVIIVIILTSISSLKNKIYRLEQYSDNINVSTTDSPPLTLDPYTEEEQNKVKILELVFANLYYPPATNKNTFRNWQTYSNQLITFKYPDDWGVGSKCSGEIRENYVGLGPNLLEFPRSNCGTANTPAHIEFYTLDTYSKPVNYRILREKTISIDDRDSESYLYIIRDRSKAGNTLYNEVVIPLDTGYLVARLNSDSNFINYKNIFDKILTTLVVELNI